MKASTEAVSVEIKIKSQIKLKRKSLAYQRVWFSLTLSAKRRRQLIHPLTPPPPRLSLVLCGSSTGQPRFYSFTLGHTPNRKKKTLGKVTEEQSRRQGFFFFFLNASGLHCGESPHKRMGSCRQASPPLLPHPSFVQPSSAPPHSRTCPPHLHPNRKYRLGSQRGFLIQTSPLEQPAVASLPFFLPLSLFFWLCRLQPAAPACPHNTCADTHTHRHISMIAHKCTPTASPSSLEEPKAFRQLTKALCGLTHSRKEGECEKGLMIKIGVCVRVCIFVCVVVISHPGHLGATSKVQLKSASTM